MGELKYEKLSGNDIAERVRQFPNWRFADGQLVADYVFDTYEAGLVFACAVGHVANRLDHHPDLTIGYKKVRVAMNTHSVGGISPYDFELVRRIESIG